MSDQDIKTVKQIRSELKNFIYDEIQNLPDSLNKLEPKERLEMLVKLMPYALPKNGKISATYGEPSSWDLD